MSSDPCPPIRTLLPAYALDALDAAERRRVDAHIPGCDSCQDALADFRAIEDGLLRTVPARAPRPGVRAGLIAKLGETRPRNAGAPRRWAPMFAGLALVALFVSNLLLVGQLRAARAQQAALSEQLGVGQLALDLLAQAGTRTYVAQGDSASGQLIVNPSANSAVLLAQGLAPLGTEQTYQLWLIPAEGQPVGIGFYEPSVEAKVFVLPIQPGQVLADYAGFGITIEPAAGSPTPTGPLVLAVDL